MFSTKPGTMARFGAKARYLEGYDDGFPTIAPVMGFSPNPLVLFDMEGNVKEWGEDWFNTKQEYRAARGGSLNVAVESYLRSSSRSRDRPEIRRGDYGFRFVLETQ